MKSFSYNFYFTTEYTEFHGVKSERLTTVFHRATVIASHAFLNPLFKKA